MSCPSWLKISSLCSFRRWFFSPQWLQPLESHQLIAVYRFLEFVSLTAPFLAFQHHSRFISYTFCITSRKCGRWPRKEHFSWHHLQQESLGMFISLGSFPTLLWPRNSRAGMWGGWTYCHLPKHPTGEEFHVSLWVHPLPATRGNGPKVNEWLTNGAVAGTAGIPGVGPEVEQTDHKPLPAQVNRLGVMASALSSVVLKLHPQSRSLCQIPLCTALEDRWWIITQARAERNWGISKWEKGLPKC